MERYTITPMAKAYRVTATTLAAGPKIVGDYRTEREAMAALKVLQERAGIMPMDRQRSPDWRR